MKKNRTSILLLLGALWIVGCATGKTLVVLLPDPDGQVGEIEISNKDGTRNINQAGYAVAITRDNAPQPAVKMSENEINRIFAKALVAEPAPPAKYILYFFWDSIELKPHSLVTIEQIISGRIRSFIVVVYIVTIEIPFVFRNFVDAAIGLASVEPTGALIAYQ